MPHLRRPNARVRNIADARQREHHHRQYGTSIFDAVEARWNTI
jgi:hypothetical protein